MRDVKRTNVVVLKGRPSKEMKNKKIEVKDVVVLKGHPSKKMKN